MTSLMIWSGSLTFDDLEKELEKKADTIKALLYGIERKIRMVDDLVMIREENE